MPRSPHTRPRAPIPTHGRPGTCDSISQVHIVTRTLESDSALFPFFLVDQASFFPQRRASPTRTSSSSCTQICCASRSVPTRKRCNAFFADNKSLRSQSLKLRQKIAIRELTFSLRLVRIRLPSHPPTLFLYVFAPFRRVPVIVYCMELAHHTIVGGGGVIFLFFR